MKPIDQSDQQQRQTALDPQCSFIVRAAAGSGKTELLIQRFLTLLSVVAQPEQIIAITFTRQAAAEMRGRIMQALFATKPPDEPPKTDHAKETHRLAEAALQQDQHQQWQLADNPSRLRIQTIDSLCASITQQAPLLSGLSKQLGITENATALYLLAAERTVTALDQKQDWTPALMQLLQHLDNDLPRLKQLLADMLGKRDQWLRYLNNGRIDRSALEQSLQNHIIANLISATTAIHSVPDSEQLIVLLRHAASNLKDGDADSAIVNCLDLDRLPDPDRQSLKYWQGLIELLLTNGGQWRKTVNKNTGFPSAGDKKEQIMELIGRYTDHPSLLDNLSNIRQLGKINDAIGSNEHWLNDQQWQLIQALCQLLIVTEAQLRVLFAERYQTDYISVQQAALHALGNEQQPSDLVLRLDQQIQHLLIDEFQDISISQYQLLERLTEAWGEGDGHSLFVVGDPMQSIYRFREAEVGKFISTYQNQRLGQIALHPLSLDRNYRSRPALIDWVNEAFAKFLSPQADTITGAVSYSPVLAATSGTGQVVVHPQLRQTELHSEAQMRQQEAQQISQLITDLRQHQDQRTIAILATKRSQLGLIIEQLQQDNILLQALDMQSLDRRSAIQDCLALTRALLHPADRIAWLAVLRAPWSGLSLADLHCLVATEDKTVTVWELMQDAAIEATLSADGQHQFARLKPILGKALTNRRRRSLRRLVEMVWMEIGGPATLKESIDLHNVQTYLDLLQSHEQAADLNDLSGFTDALQRCYAAVPALNTQSGGPPPVQIMTIHKAKGLEFDIVILPGLHRTGKSDDPRLLLWQEQQQANGKHELLLAPIKDRTEAEDPLYSYLDKLEKHKLQHERGRLLYVATTRAKQQLHLFGTAKIKNDKVQQPPAGSLLAKIWPMVANDYEQASSDRVPTTVAPVTEQQHYRCHAKQWQSPQPPPDIYWQQYAPPVATDTETIEYQWAGDTIRHIGTVVHQQLQQLAEQAPLPDVAHIQSQQADYEQALRQQGVPPSELKVAAQQVVTALSNTLSDRRGRWLLSNQHRHIQNEYALTGVCQQTKAILRIKIDRTFIDRQGTRWIIDYKTSRHQGPGLAEFLEQQQQRYSQQLTRYAQLISHQQQTAIKLGLYFPLLQAWRAWSYQAENDHQEN